jgi:hypothetical protein
MTATHRRWALWIILLPIAAGLAFSRSDEAIDPAAVVEAVARPAEIPVPDRRRSSPEEARARDEVMIAVIHERRPASDVKDFFAPHDWTRSSSSAAPPPAPTAPPLPYQVLGKKLEDGAWQVFLTRDDNVHIVKPGDLLDEQYRIEKIEPPALVMTYLPLNERQTLAIGGEP